MIDVAALRALRAVDHLGTLSRAAEELGFTASAVSQQLKRLERQLGEPVLAPAGRGVVLTPAGRALAEASGDVLAALERATEAARTAGEGRARGVLRVAAFSTAVRGLLAPTLPGLAERHPDLRVALTEQDPADAVRSLLVGTADLAVVHDAEGLPVTVPPALRRRQVLVDVGDVVLAETHPLAGPDAPLGARDLVRYPWVSSPEGTVCHQWFRQQFADVEGTPEVHHLIDDFSTQVALVRATGVLALVPRLARPPLPDGVVARQLERPPQRSVDVVWRASAEASPGIRAVLAALT